MLTSKTQFLKWKNEGFNFIPIVYEMPNDLETPLSIYLKLANEPYSYLLESGHPSEHSGRYSFIGLNSHTRISIKNHEIQMTQQNKITARFKSETPLTWLFEHIKEYRVPTLNELTRFNGGFVGYFGYETINYIEPRLDNLATADILNLPDIYLLRADQFVVVDNFCQKMYLVIYTEPSSDDAYDIACLVIEQLKQKLKQGISFSSHDMHNNSSTTITSNFTKEEYEEAVTQAKKYFERGDAMQVVLSQRFSQEFSGQPLAFYHALRSVNPSPYLFYLNMNDFYIVGASPEILLRVEENIITVRPLAGTRPRGKTPDEDQQLEKELLTDEKELAEHLMLIDLGRNDIGRVCKTGSVAVTQKMSIERFSHVMHISSTVMGKLKPDISALEALCATFPAGTVSGAPKIRAMEIIAELEKEKRGVYAGAIGYIAWNGNCDMAIALRTAVIKEGKIFIQAGAGLVADSDPTCEWQECINKSRALFHALEFV